MEKTSLAAKKEPQYHIIKRKQICSLSEAIYFTVGSVIYIACFIPITYYTIYMPEYDTENTDMRKFLSKDTYFTTIFSTGKLTLWMTMVITGFLFVNIVTLMNQRHNPFKGRDGTYKDFGILVVASFLLYFIAPMITLRARNDMQRDFQFHPRWPNNIPLENQYPNCKGNLVCIEPYPILPVFPDFVRFIIREFALAYHIVGLPVSSNGCYLYTDKEIIIHNMIFVVSFCLGLNFTHLDFPPFSQIGFNNKKFKKMNWISYFLTLCFFIFIAINAYYVYYAHQFSLTHMRYVYLTIAIVVVAVLRTILLSKTHYLHVHHWTCGMVLLLYLGFQNVYFGFLGGISAGVMVEGAARWGFVDVWKVNNWQSPKVKTE